MKKRLVWLIALLLAPGAIAYASPAHADAGVSINLPGFGLNVGPAGVGLNVGLPWVVAPAPEPVYAYPETAYTDPYETVVAEAAPEFILPPELGFYVAVGVPYDLFFYNNSYYIYRGNIWYYSSYYNGPWSRMYHSNIPYVFNRYPFERIRHYRDSYYGRYQRYGTWDGYRHFRPGHRAEYRGGGYGRDRRDYVRPHRPDQTIRNRPDVRRPNSNWQGRDRYTSTRPIPRDRNYRDNSAYTRPIPRDRDYRDTSAYTRPIPRDRNYRDTSAYTRSPNNRQVHSARPAYNRSYSTGQRNYGDRPAQISPSRVAPNAGNRAVYTRPNRNVPSYGNNNAYTRQYATGQGHNGRASYSRASNGRQTTVGRPVYNRTNSSNQGIGARGAGHSQNWRGNANRGWQGDRR